jgi:hypothetical protein
MTPIIQIPCLDEAGHIGATVADLPRLIDVVFTIENLII